MPEIPITRKDLTDWNEYYTIEFNGTKGWEIVWFKDKTFGLHEACFVFLNRAVNNDGQYRLTIPAQCDRLKTSNKKDE